MREWYGFVKDPCIGSGNKQSGGWSMMLDVRCNVCNEQRGGWSMMLDVKCNVCNEQRAAGDVRC